jgi:hypothetical protein
MVVHRSPIWRAIRSVAILLVLLLSVTVMPAWAIAGAVNSAIGAHSALYLNHPFSAKEAMFKEARAMGASTIRLDISIGNVFPTAGGPPDWHWLDECMLLARRYHLRVLANLHGTPYYLTSPSCRDYHCAPNDPAGWAALAGAIAAHTRGVIDYFEIINEPDGTWSFRGKPQQYAAIIAASYTAIHHANPNARVVLGGLMHTTPAATAWINSVLATPGANAIHRFDIANVHIRSRAASAGAIVSSWRRYFSSKGFRGPLWITEMSYPADTCWQHDPAYRGGAPAQARYMKAVIPAMINAGAGKVFVTLRDWQGRFASEGVLDTDDPLTAFPRYTRRPSFYTVCKLATMIHSPAAVVTRPELS